MLVLYPITVTTAVGGAQTAYSPKLNGKLISIRYAKTDYTNGVDFTITSETVAQNLWVDTNIDASETVRPRIAVQNSAGADLTYDGTRKVYEPYNLVDEKIKIVIAQGGDAKVGTFHILIDQ